MIFCFVRETKQLTLEELDRKSSPSANKAPSPLSDLQTLMMIPAAEVFSIPTSKYISHEATVWLPYFIKRHILRKKIAKPPNIIDRQARVEDKIKA